MLRRISLALFAAASLSAIALAPSAASARAFGHGFGGGFGGDGFHHFHRDFGVGFVGECYGDGCYVLRSVPTPYGYRLRTINVCAD